MRKRIYRKISTKKFLGVKGSFVIDYLAITVVSKKPELIEYVLWPLIVYYAALFGIKMLNILKGRGASPEGGEE